MDPNEIQTNLPSYLTSYEQSKLREAFLSYEDKALYTKSLEGPYYQGDVWRGFKIRNHKGEEKAVTGIALSNSCDIAPENTREIRSKVTFCPLIPLRKYLMLLEKAGRTNDEINQKADIIRKQHITNLFYLPEGDGVESESIVLLDDIYSCKSDCLFKNPDTEVVCRLNQLGHYLLLFKLSIHFCRFGEQVNRGL